MSCFGGRTSPDLYQNCCNANNLCEFSGNISDLCTEPIYVQKVYDAVLFNLQGMKTVQNQSFKPHIPKGHRVKRVVDIRCKRFFNPCNINDPCNLTLDVDTGISGATFLQNSNGEQIRVVGPDGTFSEKVLYVDTTECDEQCMGTPIFGTQNITITGNVEVFLDLLITDRCNNDSMFTVCADVNISDVKQPMVLTNFFEMCMPSTIDTAFLPRFTEFCNPACETRLATNNFGRDLNVANDGCVSANLIIAICISCEKKIVVPVQLCVLSTGFAQISTQVNNVCTSFPSLFPQQIRERDTLENCGVTGGVTEDECGHKHKHGHGHGCIDNCNSFCEPDDFDLCADGNVPNRRPARRR